MDAAQMAAEGTVENQIQHIEVDKKTALQQIKDRDDLLKLFNNRVYKRIFTELYFKEESTRLVMMKCDPRFKEEIVDKQMYGISALNGFLGEIIMKGNAADEAIREYEGALDELREEELNDGRR